MPEVPAQRNPINQQPAWTFVCIQQVYKAVPMSLEHIQNIQLTDKRVYH